MPANETERDGIGNAKLCARHGLGRKGGIRRWTMVQPAFLALSKQAS